MFKNFFDSTPAGENAEPKKDEITSVISLEGRTYPVDVMYLDEPCEDYVETAIKTVLDIHLKEPEGDVLLFLTGRDEIERCVAEISERLGQLDPSTPKLNPLPLYAGLPVSEQMAVFQPAHEGERKVIVATNVAEASVTIDGIVYVVDSGFVKAVPAHSRTKCRCAPITLAQESNPSSSDQYPKPQHSREQAEQAEQNQGNATDSTEKQLIPPCPPPPSPKSKEQT